MDKLTIRSDYYRLLELIYPALCEGVEIQIYIDDDERKLCVNVNTDGKSSCILVAEEDGIYAYRRYDRRDKVEDWDHLVELVYDCVHFRSFFNSSWLRIFKKEGLSDPLGCF